MPPITGMTNLLHVFFLFMGLFNNTCGALWKRWCEAALIIILVLGEQPFLGDFNFHFIKALLTQNNSVPSLPEEKAIRAPVSSFSTKYKKDF